MSKDGRAQDAVYEILGGYSTQVDYIPGPMNNHQDLSKTVQLIVDALRNIYSIGGRENMAVVTFEPDQLMEILAWLEDQKAAGLDLDEIIEGITSGYLTTRVTITDRRHSSFSNSSLPV